MGQCWVGNDEVSEMTTRKKNVFYGEGLLMMICTSMDELSLLGVLKYCC